MRLILPSRPVRLRPAGGRLAVLATVAVLSFGSSRVLAGPEPLAAMRTSTAAPTLQDLIAEASRRFGVPVAWIAEIMSVESRGRADALSPKRAIGLMQVMPATYADLASRYGLGADPWNPRDNVLAGAAYLRELYDRYGAPGFLVAYNAGPGRWDDYRIRARPLPAETIAYIARLAPVVGGRELSTPDLVDPIAPRSPFGAPIFVQLTRIAATSQAMAERERIVRIIEANATVIGQSETLFASRYRGDAAASADPAGGENRADQPSVNSGQRSAQAAPERARIPLFPTGAGVGAQR